jgi:hypothetical protein
MSFKRKKRVWRELSIDEVGLIKAEIPLSCLADFGQCCG